VHRQEEPPLSAPGDQPLYQLYGGIDIAARTFTASIALPHQTPAKASSFEQTAQDFEKLKKWLLSKDLPAQHILIVMEATGNYWIELATYLHANGFVVSVVNPRQAHAFANALGHRPKNDLLDAQTLCRLASSLPLPAWNPPPQIYRELYQRLAHRQALMEARQQFRNQLHALSVAMPVEAVSASLDKLIDTLTESIKQVETEIKVLLKAESEWASSIALLQTIAGIGWLSACWLVVTTLNFTTCESAEALTHYAGLAPVERSSGTSVRSRPTIGNGGHSRLRAMLYMAAGIAMRFNPVIKSYTQRLREDHGKAYKVARCAAARKLVHLAFAIVKSGKAFDPYYSTSRKADDAAKTAVGT
jgi:transposase